MTGRVGFVRGAVATAEHKAVGLSAAQSRRPHTGQSGISMVSSTRQSERRRAINKSRQGRANKKERLRAGTPRFPVHPEGYDPTAADAKKTK
jgi:hypothetical protein